MSLGLGLAVFGGFFYNCIANCGVNRSASRSLGSMGPLHRSAGYRLPCFTTTTKIFSFAVGIRDAGWVDGVGRGFGFRAEAVNVQGFMGLGFAGSFVLGVWGWVGISQKYISRHLGFTEF